MPSPLLPLGIIVPGSRNGKGELLPVVVDYVSRWNLTVIPFFTKLFPDDNPHRRHHDIVDSNADYGDKNVSLGSK